MYYDKVTDLFINPDNGYFYPKSKIIESTQATAIIESSIGSSDFKRLVLNDGETDYGTMDITHFIFHPCRLGYGTWMVLYDRFNMNEHKDKFFKCGCHDFRDLGTCNHTIPARLSFHYYNEIAMDLLFAQKLDENLSMLLTIGIKLGLRHYRSFLSWKDNYLCPNTSNYKIILLTMIDQGFNPCATRENGEYHNESCVLYVNHITLFKKLMIHEKL